MDGANLQHLRKDTLAIYRMYCLRGIARYAVKDIDLTAWFLAHGADPDASCMLGLTPLTFAIRDADLSIIEMLFAHGGDV